MRGNDAPRGSAAVRADGQRLIQACMASGSGRRSLGATTLTNVAGRAVRWDRSGRVADLGLLSGGYPQRASGDQLGRHRRRHRRQSRGDGLAAGHVDTAGEADPVEIAQPWGIRPTQRDQRPRSDRRLERPEIDRQELETSRGVDRHRTRGRAPVPPQGEEDEAGGVALAVNERGTIMGRPLNGADSPILWKPRTLCADPLVVPVDPSTQ